MLGHIRILFKATGGKFEQPSEKRQRNMRKMAINRLLERTLFSILNTNCQNYLPAFGFCRRCFNKQVHTKICFLRFLQLLWNML